MEPNLQQPWYGSRFTAAENLNFGVPIFYRLGVHLNKVSLLEDEVVKIPGESVHQYPETLIGAMQLQEEVRVQLSGNDISRTNPTHRHSAQIVG